MRNLAKVAACTLVAALLITSVPGEMNAAKKIKLSKTKATLTVGKTLQLRVKGTKAKVTWTSSKKSVARVSKKGKVIAKKPGNAKIIAKVSKKKLTCKLTVKAKGNGGRKETTAPSVTTSTVPPVESTAPVSSVLPASTNAPECSAMPETSLAPAGSNKPAESNKPVESSKPAESVTPGESQAPVETTPVVTPEPTVTPTPIPFDTTETAPPAPVFSTDSGVFDAAFTLTMDVPEGANIYYTTDGSIPTLSSNKYENGIQIVNRNGLANVLCSAENIKKMCIGSNGWGWGNAYDYVPKANEVAKCTVIRAAAFSPTGYRCSDVVTKTYFVGNDLANKYKGATVASLVIDPDSLLNYETGIHVLGKIYDDWKKTSEGRQIIQQGAYWNYEGNYTQKGRDWERQAELQYFDSATGNVEFDVPVGVRLHGGASRMYGQKSFNIYMREEYGQKNLKYELLPGDVDKDGKAIGKYKSFMLRNGGNDTEYTKCRDLFIQNQLTDRAYSVQATRPCVVFLNGEYWGLYNISEKYSDNSLAETFGVKKDNVITIKEGELDDGAEGDEVYYDELMDYAEKDFTDDSVYNEFCNIMDIDSFADYYATEIYIANQDWGLDKNYEIWRTRTTDSESEYGDCKWRYLLFDTEYSMGLYGSTDERTNSMQNAMSKDALFAAVMKNPGFQQKFLAAIKEIGSVNFNPEVCIAKLNEYANLYHPLMKDFYARFGYDDWAFDDNIETVKNFVQNRYNNVVGYVEKYCK